MPTLTLNLMGRVFQNFPPTGHESCMARLADWAKNPEKIMLDQFSFVISNKHTITECSFRNSRSPMLVSDEVHVGSFNLVAVCR